MGFSVTRTGSTAGSLPVFYTVRGIAMAGVDYNALVGTVIILAGSLGAIVTVAIRDDKGVEPQETMRWDRIPWSFRSLLFWTIAPRVTKR